MSGQGEQNRVRRSAGFGLAFVVALMSLLALASAASAGGIGATVASISGVENGYLLTVKNEGSESTEGVMLISQGNGPASNVAPGTCTWNQPVPGTIGCPKLAAGATIQVCYIGGAPESVTFFEAGAPNVTPAKAGPVGSCPVAGFNPPAGGGGGSNGGNGNQSAEGPKLGKAKTNAKNGTATLNVNVPEAGTVKLTGKGVKSSTKTATAPGAIGMPVKATGKTAKHLAKNGKVTVNVTVTFTPTGGTPSKLTKTVKLLER